MSDATDADVQALAAEMRNLRADVERIASLLKDTARHGAEDAKDAFRDTAEMGWNEAKAKAQSVIDEIEQRPVQSAYDFRHRRTAWHDRRATVGA